MLLAVAEHDIETRNTPRIVSNYIRSLLAITLDGFDDRSQETNDVTLASRILEIGDYAQVGRVGRIKRATGRDRIAGSYDSILRRH